MRMDPRYPRSTPRTNRTFASRPASHSRLVLLLHFYSFFSYQSVDYLLYFLCPSCSSQNLNPISYVPCLFEPLDFFVSLFPAFFCLSVCCPYSASESVRLDLLILLFNFDASFCLLSFRLMMVWLPSKQRRDKERGA